MEKSFETEVLTRLSVIESKLDGYKDIEKTVYDTDRRSLQNKDDILELQDKLKWVSRTAVGSIITGGIGLIYALIKLGLGV